MHPDIKHLLTKAIKASVDAGDVIMKIYNTSFNIEHKEDNSPLTIADKNAHEIITDQLLETNIPVLSEEGKNIPYTERKNWEYFWMVDPLDGTKEFIKRNGEFTVNIALIHKQKSILGIIYIPATQTIYFGVNSLGAYKYEIKNEKDFSAETIMLKGHQLPLKKNKGAFTVVASRSHLNPETNVFIEDLNKKHEKIDFVSSGSSIKLCLVAEGSADIYPRFAPTMEWDTAAGQAIAEAAGKKVIDRVTQKPLLYNKENLLNNWFIVE